MSTGTPGLPRIAFVGRDRQLYAVGVDEAGPVQVTWSHLAGGLEAVGGPAADATAWPCWSPDGRWLMGFRASERGKAAQLFIAEVGGVEERSLFDSEDEHPIYASWSPDGQRIGLLSQQDEELQLSVIEVRTGTRRLVDQGVPLFFTWAPDSTSVLVHSGGREGRPGRLARRTVLGTGEDHAYPAGPGSFCAPVVIRSVPPRVVFATASPGAVSHICLSDLDGEQPCHLATQRGLLALLADRTGAHLAVASAPKGNGTPYEGFGIYQIETGQVQPATTRPLLAFFWCRPNRLVYASLDAKAGCARWTRVELDASGEAQERELVSFWPTREQVFLLHFFEQFAESHPIVDASGRYLCWAGHADPSLPPSPEGSLDDTGKPHPGIFCLDLDQPDLPPRRLASGSIATFGPSAA